MRKQQQHIMSSSASLLLAWVTFYFIVLSQIVMMASSTKLLDQSAERNLNLFDTRIIGGKEAPEDRHPYSVSLQQSNFHFCGGSLILKDVVLTAAHCLNGGNFDVLIGRHDFNDNDGEKIPISRTIIHPLYNKDEDSYDVGLVILSRPVQDKNIPLIALNNDNPYPQPGTLAHVMGWGDVDPSSALVTVDELHIVSVEVISNEECETITIGGQNYEGMIFDSMLCASTEGQDACQGDSGGPLIVRGNSAANDVQVGVVSWGIGCAYLPGVFSRVSMAFDWIQDNACRRSSDKTGSTLCGTQPETPITDEPSRKPTPQPTNLPSPAPTQPPSLSPTDKPTTPPTSKPSSAPTARPSPFPSPPPTNQPSPRPSPSPTNEPITLFPTNAPSPLPTTAKPSSSPSNKPTSFPSVISSENPSLQPSEIPSSSPSVSPSISSSPSMIPTMQPSKLPSLSPTTSPSVHPSFPPSSNPSISPTFSPTPAPSAEPSGMPSEPPSTSQSPSRVPTWQPSNMPSSHPTVHPSLHPSASPSSQPTYSPTSSLKPSPAPSAQASETPSGIPSLAPSNSPSSSSVPTLSLVPTNAKYDRLRPDEIEIKLYGLRDPLILSSSALAPEDFESNSSSRLKKKTSVAPLISLTVSTILFLLPSR